jgi:maleylpyruvate isomerase
MNLALYSYWRSGCSWRVRIGLGLKGLEAEYRAVNLLEGQHFQEAHRSRNPMGQVPVLAVEEGGKVLHLTQSMAILEWLEERFPSPPLLPADPAGRARVRALAEHVNAGIQPYQNAAPRRFLQGKQAGLEDEWTRHFVGAGMAALEAAVKGGAGRFCHGDQPTLADLYLVPQLGGARRFGVDVSGLPTLLRVEGACQALDAFRRAEPERQPDAPPSPP